MIGNYANIVMVGSGSTDGVRWVHHRCHRRWCVLVVTKASALYARGVLKTVCLRTVNQGHYHTAPPTNQESKNNASATNRYNYCNKPKKLYNGISTIHIGIPMAITATISITSITTYHYRCHRHICESPALTNLPTTTITPTATTIAITTCRSMKVFEVKATPAFEGNCLCCNWRQWWFIAGGVALGGGSIVGVIGGFVGVGGGVANVAAATATASVQ